MEWSATLSHQVSAMALGVSEGIGPTWLRVPSAPGCQKLITLVGKAKDTACWSSPFGLSPILRLYIQRLSLAGWLITA